MSLLEKLERELKQLEEEIKEKGLSAPPPAEDEKLRAELRTLAQALPWPEMNQEVVEALDAWLEPAPVPRHLVDRVLLTCFACSRHLQRQEPLQPGA